MKAGMFFLVTAYVLSQFYRAFLAVLSPVLEAEIGAGPGDLAIASGLWFVSFAAMQIPIGWALDSIGPRRTACGLLALGGGGGAVVMALAQGPAAIWVAMVLIGIGCAPVLMASYYILARNYPPVVFATLAGVIVGVGSLGNIAAALPTAWAVEAFGWRQTLWGLAAITLVTAAAIALTVHDPDMPDGGKKGRLIDILRIRGLWPVLAMMLVCYAPAAGIRGLWSGPYLADVFAADVTRIGTATLIMGLAMVLANFIYGPLDRLLGTRKWIIFTGNLMTAIFCGGHRPLRLVLPGDHGAWAQLLSAASGRARGDLDEPVLHRRRRHHAIRQRPDLYKAVGGQRPARGLRRPLRSLRSHRRGRPCLLPFRAGPRGLSLSGHARPPSAQGGGHRPQAALCPAQTRTFP